MINIKEKIYSKAFENGVNYVIQKMFNEEKNKWILPTIGTVGTIGGGIAAEVMSQRHNKKLAEKTNEMLRENEESMKNLTASINRARDAAKRMMHR